MVFDCGVWCAKYLLCILNFIFFVSTPTTTTTTTTSEWLMKFQHSTISQAKLWQFVSVFSSFFLAKLHYKLCKARRGRRGSVVNQANLCACAVLMLHSPFNGSMTSLVVVVTVVAYRHNQHQHQQRQRWQH